jgi:hypothetical protein
MDNSRVDRIRAAVLLGAWEERGYLMLRLAPRDGGHEEVVRCNADVADLAALKEAADHCLEALQRDDSEVGVGD